jgi:hypothetical protein
MTWCGDIMNDSIFIFDGSKITLMEEHENLTGGRAKINPPTKCYTQIDVSRDGEEVLFSLSDNITDVDGHWSGISLTRDQFEEFKAAINEL